MYLGCGMLPNMTLFRGMSLDVGRGDVMFVGAIGPLSSLYCLRTRLHVDFFTIIYFLNLLR